MTSRIALVTGATGYIGGLLVPQLLENGWQVRVLSRHPETLRTREWGDRVDVTEGNASDPADMARALDGVEVAYYLLHSMDGGGDFVRRDREMAQVVADAATAAGVRRMVYLSGLHPTGHLSPHLGSRVEVGEILLASGVPTAVLQAGVVLGDGSASFDMLRHLTERLPAVVAPRWLRNRIQPVAVDDVMHYLVGAADLAPEVNRTFDVGGPDVLTYAEMMREYARVTGLGSPLIATVPVLTPELASHWVGAVTPVSAGIARPLVGSLVHEAICHEDDILDVIGPPPGGRMSYADAIEAATAGFDPAGWRHQAYRVVGRTVGVLGVGAIVAGLVRRKS
ncbi:NAD(P)H-binding protein [Allobranchiibius sp. GilTou73]|uniref:NAD(P)H-binding protein n=1 Tax=Allobranchiibius sp. GilTou73 TaxID=2904523 RepID=UPI001F4060FF|nr:NAD(P)H-binding protein [Allobranchiibius sp. GilTou73]UIJ33419.1 NAD(P)H-binding protein [Allobranchiibius sp. GilTou73]